MKKTVNTLINLSLLALALLALVSCDNESSVPGGLVTMKIDFRGMETGSSEELRSASSEIVSSQRIVLPSGEEWQVDLSIDPESPLRAGPLNSNSYIRMLAIDGSGNLVRSVDWRQDVDNVPDLYIPAGTTCRFICYSYNNSYNTLPSGYTEGSFLPALSVRDAGSKELLLWQTTAATTINNAGTISNVVLTPQLTQVKLKLDCSGDGKTITGVSTTTPITLTSGFTGGATYNLAGGALVTAVSSSNLPFVWTTSTFGGTTVTSNPLTLVPQTGFTLTIPANAIMLQTGVTQNTLTEIPFPTSQLAAGKTHTIRVQLVKTSYTKFASSNIYWDTTTDPAKPKLTFKPYSSNPATEYATEQHYQGVFFLFGSLIGISPATTTGAGNDGRDFTGSTIVYVPTYNSPPASSSWTRKSTNTYTWPPSSLTASGSNDIPYERETDGSDDRTVSWMNAPARNEPNIDWAAGTGDICLYISTTQNMGNTYRLPTSKEFGEAIQSIRTSSLSTDGWKSTGGSWSTSFTTDAAGTATIANGAYYGSTGNFFPASGHRTIGSSTLYDTGYYGYYWSGSVNGNNGYLLLFYNTYVNPAGSYGRTYGFAVRCVLQE